MSEIATIETPETTSTGLPGLRAMLVSTYLQDCEMQKIEEERTKQRAKDEARDGLLQHLSRRLHLPQELLDTISSSDVDPIQFTEHPKHREMLAVVKLDGFFCCGNLPNLYIVTPCPKCGLEVFSQNILNSIEAGEWLAAPRQCKSCRDEQDPFFDE